MSNDAKGKTFYAKAAKGYIPKVSFDAMATSMSRFTMRLTKKGIFIREADAEDIRKAHILWDVQWPRKRFSAYRCVKESVITLNAKHLQKMLRNVKKKDSLIFFITKDDENQLGIIIQPTGTTSGGPAARSETVYLSIQHVQSVLPHLPDVYRNEDGEECPAYGHPMVIGSSDFQKIKKMSNVCKSLKVKIQRNNYISFRAGDTSVMSSHLTFGELLHAPESDSEAEDEDEESDDEDVEETDGAEGSSEEEYEDDESEAEDASEEEDGGSITSSTSEEYPDIYEQEFNMSLFVPLVKLPGLTTQMEFYAPKAPAFPLKISMTATSGLGDITVFVKDRNQIAIAEEAYANSAKASNASKKKK